jgi:selenocysteine lyase/cysteine desulfurase
VNISIVISRSKHLCLSLPSFLFSHKIGSTGAYPKSVQTALRAFQDAQEARPDHNLRFHYRQHLDISRAAVASLLNAPSDTIVFVPNTTNGINTVLRNLTFFPGEKILHFSTIYNSCGNTVQYITKTTPAEAVVIRLVFPISDDTLVKVFRDTIVAEQAAGYTIKVAVFEAICSLPGVRLPFERLITTCKELGVLSCLDAAHGVGHISLDLEELSPDFFVSNCHK